MVKIGLRLGQKLCTLSQEKSWVGLGLVLVEITPTTYFAYLEFPFKHNPAVEAEEAVSAHEGIFNFIYLFLLDGEYGDHWLATSDW